ncbi:NUDIX hydrolase [Trypanosoma grayi]|uniref:NUDIX hydrolase n=1 Tax=Trypanosoma grayi TaxID=71804 RepID=UPI0004F45335|nr:NUDIX hydrolase [Trypanosoma grayi]KEG15127.1 NUDIX hydrolase [Trypanosoma grayi]
MRMGLLLRCLRKELALVVPTDAGLLGKLLCPTIQSSQLASLATETAAVVQRLNGPQTVTILELYSRHGVRHEQLMLACMWNVFKADLPVSFSNHNNGLMPTFAVCTSTTFRLMCQEGFVHDPQLLAIALGRCVECAPYMSFSGVVDVYEGIRLLDRQYFNLAEVALHENETAGQRPHLVGEESSRTLSSQPNVVDVLCTELESRLQSSVDEGCEHTPTDVERLLQSLAVVGLMDARSLSAVCQTIETMSVPIECMLGMLTSVHKIHTRVMDVLDHEGDDEYMQTERSELVRVLTDKLMALNVFGASRRSDPQLVLRFRRLFEKYPVLAESAPQLWDAVRCIRVAHKHAACQTEKKHRLGGALFKSEYAVKKKPIIVDISETEKYVPPQFKTWRGPNVNSQRHKGPTTPRKVGFGTRRVSRNYIKMKRKKFAPAVW